MLFKSQILIKYTEDKEEEYLTEFLEYVQETRDEILKNFWPDGFYGLQDAYKNYDVITG